MPRHRGNRRRFLLWPSRRSFSFSHDGSRKGTNIPRKHATHVAYFLHVNTFDRNPNEWNKAQTDRQTAQGDGNIPPKTWMTWCLRTWSRIWTLMRHVTVIETVWWWRSSSYYCWALIWLHSLEIFALSVIRGLLIDGLIWLQRILFVVSFRFAGWFGSSPLICVMGCAQLQGSPTFSLFYIKGWMAEERVRARGEGRHGNQ